jgi:hypothetical protein
MTTLKVNLPTIAFGMSVMGTYAAGVLHITNQFRELKIVTAMVALVMLTVFCVEWAVGRITSITPVATGIGLVCCILANFYLLVNP